MIHAGCLAKTTCWTISLEACLCGCCRLIVCGCCTHPASREGVFLGGCCSRRRSDTFKAGNCYIRTRLARTASISATKLLLLDWPKLFTFATPHTANSASRASVVDLNRIIFCCFVCFYLPGNSFTGAPYNTAAVPALCAAFQRVFVRSLIRNEGISSGRGNCKRGGSVRA